MSRNYAEEAERTAVRKALAAAGHIRLAEAAKLAGLTPHAILYHVKSGTLPAVAVGTLYMVKRSDVDVFLATRRAAGNPDMAAMRKASSDARGTPQRKPKPKPQPTAPAASGEMVFAPGFKFTPAPPTPPPRFVSVELPTVSRGTTSRAGAEDFRKFQRTGRF